MENVTVEQVWMLGLWAVWAGLLLGGFAFGKANADQTHRRIPTWARMASSLALVVAGWSMWALSGESDYHALAFWVALGMTFGFLGDLFLALLLPVKDPVLAGIGAFGAGHVAYITGLVQHGSRHTLDDPAARWGALAVWLVIGAVAWFFVVYRGGDSKREAVHFAALPYALLLAATTGFATGLALQSAPFILVALGAALFLISDLILAAQLFNGLRFRLIGDVVWLSYGPGQMLIVFGVALMAVF